MFKKLIPIFLLFAMTSCSSFSGQNNIYKSQVTMLGLGISQDQCLKIKDNTDIDPRSCDLLIEQYKAYSIKAKKLLSMVPANLKTKDEKFYIDTISALMKFYPDTTDQEIFDAITNKRPRKNCSEINI